MPYQTSVQAYTEPVFGSLAPDALTLGRLVTPDRGIVERINYGDDQHVLVFGPNGKGKGTGILQPNLLQMDSASIVCIDPKGECAAITAPYRRRIGRVVVLNPFQFLTDLPGYSDLRSCGFNPLAPLNPDAPSFNADCDYLAQALIDIGETKEPHWPMSGRALVSILLMETVIEARASERIPRMSRFRELLCQASEGRHAGNNFAGLGLPVLAERMMRSRFPFQRNKATQFYDWTREVQGIASTARIQTNFLDDPPIADDLDCVSRPGFDFRHIKDQPVTVYVVLPPLEMERHSKWLRLVVTSALRAVMRPRLRYEPRIWFMMDEFFALGSLEIIAETWALVRGYGIQMMPILQDLSQLKKLYPHLWETFIGMAGAVMSYAPNDRTTAEFISQRAGETMRFYSTTSRAVSDSQSWGNSTSPEQFVSRNEGWSRSVSENTNITLMKSPLITSHKVRGFEPFYGLLSLDRSQDIFPVYTPPYFNVLSLARRARRNPYYAGV